MKNSNDKLILLLTELIEISMVAGFCYKTAAEEITDQDLKTIFTIYTSQRDNYSTELKNAAQKLTENEIEFNFDSFQSKSNKIKSLFTKSDSNTILTECNRIEDEAKKLYKSAIDSDLPPGLKEIIENQYKEILDSRDKIRFLKEAR